jgi:hypothetical protein
MMFAFYAQYFALRSNLISSNSNEQTHFPAPSPSPFLLFFFLRTDTNKLG